MNSIHTFFCTAVWSNLCCISICSSLLGFACIFLYRYLLQVQFGHNAHFELCAHAYTGDHGKSRNMCMRSYVGKDMSTSLVCSVECTLSHKSTGKLTCEQCICDLSSQTSQCMNIHVPTLFPVCMHMYMFMCSKM